MLVQALGLFFFINGIIFKLGFFVLLGVYTYIMAFGMSLGSVFYPYTTDILPSLGIGIASIAQWILACLISRFALDIMNWLGPFVIFFTFLIFCLLGSLIMMKFGVETKDREDSEIQKEFLNIASSK